MLYEFMIKTCTFYIVQNYIVKINLVQNMALLLEFRTLSQVSNASYVDIPVYHERLDINDESYMIKAYKFTSDGLTRRVIFFQNRPLKF